MKLNICFLKPFCVHDCVVSLGLLQQKAVDFGEFCSLSPTWYNDKLSNLEKSTYTSVHLHVSAVNLMLIQNHRNL